MTVKPEFHTVHSFTSDATKMEYKHGDGNQHLVYDCEIEFFRKCKEYVHNLWDEISHLKREHCGNHETMHALNRCENNIRSVQMLASSFLEATGEPIEQRRQRYACCDLEEFIRSEKVWTVLQEATVVDVHIDQSGVGFVAQFLCKDMNKAHDAIFEKKVVTFPQDVSVKVSSFRCTYTDC